MPDHSFRIIVGTVIALHAIAILCAIYLDPSQIKRTAVPPRRLVVQTVDLKPQPPQKSPPIIAQAAPPPAAKAEPPPPQKTEEPPKPAPKPAPKSAPKPAPKPNPKPAVEKKPEPKKEAKPPPKAPPKAEPKKEPPPKDNAAAEQAKAQQQAEKARQQKLLAQAQERIAKIEGNRHKVAPGSTTATALPAVPSAITSLHIDALPSVSGAAPLSSKEISYRDELAGRLKLLLRLPEYGDVKVKLTLDRSGKVVSVAIVSAESAANKKYIEKTLPDLTFPAFGSNFGSEGQYTFSVTLSNE